jgi:hypothetical protein
MPGRQASCRTVAELQAAVLEREQRGGWAAEGESTRCKVEHIPPDEHDRLCHADDEQRLAAGHSLDEPGQGAGEQDLDARDLAICARAPA